MRSLPQGFTLAECLVSLAVVSVLTGIALPTYLRAHTRTNIALLQSELVEAITRATRTSIITGSQVVLCAGDATCSTTSNWSQGWMAFMDTDRDRSLGATEAILLDRTRLPTDYRIVSSAGRQSVVFNAKGAAPGYNTTFTICDVVGRAQAQSLVLANSGRMRKQPAEQANEDACRSAPAN